MFCCRVLPYRFGRIYEDRQHRSRAGTKLQSIINCPSSLKGCLFYLLVSVSTIAYCRLSNLGIGLPAFGEVFKLLISGIFCKHLVALQGCCFLIRFYAPNSLKMLLAAMFEILFSTLFPIPLYVVSPSVWCVMLLVEEAPHSIWWYRLETSQAKKLGCPFWLQRACL
jgi:hypothetical protein